MHYPDAVVKMTAVVKTLFYHYWKGTQIEVHIFCAIILYVLFCTVDIPLLSTLKIQISSNLFSSTIFTRKSSKQILLKAETRICQLWFLSAAEHDVHVLSLFGETPNKHFCNSKTWWINSAIYGKMSQHCLQLATHPWCQYS
jgi:hypothetical protein